MPATVIHTPTVEVPASVLLRLIAAANQLAGQPEWVYDVRGESRCMNDRERVEARDVAITAERILRSAQEEGGAS